MLFDPFLMNLLHTSQVYITFRLFCLLSPNINVFEILISWDKYRESKEPYNRNASKPKSAEMGSIKSLISLNNLRILLNTMKI